MKGLGHSILMVVDEEGCGTVLSFNGMQRSLSESLMGKSGVGKLSIGAMDAEKWGVMELGEQTLAERILMFLVSF